MIRLPIYTDGILTVCDITQDNNQDYPVSIVKPSRLDIWFREISVFDRTRYDFEQGGKEITMKIRIPEYKKISSDNAVLIDGKCHQVYNAAHIINKDGFRETELTLIRPEKDVVIE